MKYFSYDRENGISFHRTAKEAKESAEEYLDADRDIAADDGWPEEVTDICWGEVKESVVLTNIQPAPEGSGFDEYHDFGLISVGEKETTDESSDS